MTERLEVPELRGVPETLLWTLYNRACEARRPDARLVDPEAVRIADAIDYDYARSFGKPDFGHPLRSLLIDRLLRSWLERHPDGQVVALAEGLETQFQRVDNGRVQWLVVDLPEVIDVRRRFLPDAPRHRNLACSALDLRWMDEVDPQRPVFITAAGLLMYLQPDQVQELIVAIAERFQAAELAFDVIPRFFVRLTLKGVKKTPHYTLPPMPWGLNRDELSVMKAWHPNIADVREIPFAGGRGFFWGVFVPAFRFIPRLGKKIFSLVHLRCLPAQGQ